MREKCQEASLEDGVPVIEVEDGPWSWGQQGQQEARGRVWLSSQPFHHCWAAQVLQCTWGCPTTHHSQQPCAQYTSLAPQLLPGHSCGTHAEKNLWCHVCCSNISCILNLSFMYTMLLLHFAIYSLNKDTSWISFLSCNFPLSREQRLIVFRRATNSGMVAGNTAGRNILWTSLSTFSK